MKTRLSSLGAASAAALLGCLHQVSVSPPASTGTQPTPGEIPARAVNANNDFGIAFLGEVAKPEQNVMISPVSLTLALGLAASGANGTTAAEMAGVLRTTGQPDRDWQRGHLEMWRLLREPKPGVEFSLANAIWVGKNMPIETNFLSVAKQMYQTSTRSVDFGSSAAAQEINDWVSGQTNNRIQNLVGRTDSLTQMMIVNAISFKAKWAKPFEKESTHDAPFMTNRPNQTKVKMMTQESRFKYAEVGGHQVLHLPYQENSFEMVIVLPKKGTEVSSFVRAMKPSDWRSWASAGQQTEVLVTIPKWTSEATINGQTPLSAMGMGIAFDPDKADFSKLSKQPSWIGAVTHKSFIKVDEEGTEAAAATGIEFKTTSAPPSEPKVFRADRPFLYAIRDVKSGTIVFMGIVSDPSRN